MSYSIAYSPACERARLSLPADKRRDLDNGMARIAQDPYGCGSSATYHKDRREATCGSVIVVYQVTNNSLLVTVVELMG
ncbi:hypothetical protein B4N89_14030 [Embleya scabrispora]|uniref:Type II toxin-antitoxin system RelE/ParE family toxin n=1 Tax=Embleya scabrispora TaxID=159449 RepID=A0A1T3NYH8_9ACTN|nr:hypothetical protein B4N89_14030 [Embleya scabrispora]